MLSGTSNLAEDVQMDLRFVSDKAFREIARDKGDDGLGVYKGYVPEVRNINKAKRTIDFIISTGSVDRMRDIIDVSGWDLTAYKANPVVLFGHSHGIPPIGKALSVRRSRNKGENGALVSRAEFATQDVNPFAETIFQLYVNGFMRATSVGFLPTEWKFVDSDEEPERRGGIDFLKQELLEYSAVPVPANSEALVDARMKGINTMPLKGWAESVLDNFDLHADCIAMSKEDLNTLRNAADPAAPTHHVVTSQQKSDLRKRNLEVLEAMSKGAIVYSKAHPNGTPLASKGALWSPKIYEGTTANRYKLCAYMTPDVTLDEAEEKDFKFTHHEADKNATVVWHGVVQSMGQLLGPGGQDLPSETARLVYDHLAKHYKEFGETPPVYGAVKSNLLCDELNFMSFASGGVYTLAVTDDQLVVCGIDVDEEGDTWANTPEPAQRFVVQQLCFNHELWDSVEAAHAWAKSHGFDVTSPTEENNLQQRALEDFISVSAISIEPGDVPHTSPDCKAWVVGGVLKDALEDVGGTAATPTPREEPEFEVVTLGTNSGGDDTSFEIPDNIIDTMPFAGDDPTAIPDGTGSQVGESVEIKLNQIQALCLSIFDDMDGDNKVFDTFVTTRGGKATVKYTLDLLKQLRCDLQASIVPQQVGNDVGVANTVELDIELDDSDDDIDLGDLDMTQEELTGLVNDAIAAVVREETQRVVNAHMGKVE